MSAGLMALYGASAAVSATIGLVFLRYWKAQHERLFGYFAGAFACFAAGWTLRIAIAYDEHQAYVFLPRLLGFLLIIVAIFDKNRRARGSGSGSGHNAGSAAAGGPRSDA
jgi:hypothetical protein